MYKRVDIRLQYIGVYKRKILAIGKLFGQYFRKLVVYLHRNHTLCGGTQLPREYAEPRTDLYDSVGIRDSAFGNDALRYGDVCQKILTVLLFLSEFGHYILFFIDYGDKLRTPADGILPVRYGGIEVYRITGGKNMIAFTDSDAYLSLEYIIEFLTGMRYERRVFFRWGASPVIISVGSTPKAEETS